MQTQQQQTVTITCKVAYQAEIRRFTLERAEYIALRDQLFALFPQLEKETVVIKYTDDEKDQVTISSDEELLVALRVSNNFLRLSLNPQQQVENPHQGENRCRGGWRRGGCGNNASNPWEAKFEKRCSNPQFQPNRIARLTQKREKLAARLAYLESQPPNGNDAVRLRHQEKLRRKLNFITNFLANAPSEQPQGPQGGCCPRGPQGFGPHGGFHRGPSHHGFGPHGGCPRGPRGFEGPQGGCPRGPQDGFPRGPHGFARGFGGPHGGPRGPRGFQGDPVAHLTHRQEKITQRLAALQALPVDENDVGRQRQQEKLSAKLKWITERLEQMSNGNGPRFSQPLPHPEFQHPHGHPHQHPHPHHAHPYAHVHPHPHPHPFANEPEQFNNNEQEDLYQLRNQIDASIAELKAARKKLKLQESSESESSSSEESTDIKQAKEEIRERIMELKKLRRGYKKSCSYEQKQHKCGLKQEARAAKHAEARAAKRLNRFGKEARRARKHGEYVDNQSGEFPKGM